MTGRCAILKTTALILRKEKLTMPKQTCRTCKYKRRIRAGSSSIYCGNEKLAMLQFDIFSEDKASCAFYDEAEEPSTDNAGCCRELTCLDCEYFVPIHNEFGLGECYTGFQGKVDYMTATIGCKWFKQKEEK
jgi:hypothetical protein